MLRPTRKRKLDAIEDATSGRPSKWSMAADGQKRTSPLQTKKLGTRGSSPEIIVTSAKAKESIKDVAANKTEDAATDLITIPSAEGLETNQATIQHVKTRADHVDYVSSSSSSSSSAELQMPPTPGRPEEAQYDTVEHDSTTEMASATTEEAENAPKSSEESTRGLDSLFIGSSGALDSLFEESFSDLDSSLEGKPNCSSKATTPDSQRAKTTSPEANLDLGHGEEGPRPRGIINRKNSCFAASVLQALPSISPFTKFYKMFTDPSTMQLLQGLKSYMHNINRWTAKNSHDLVVKESRVAKIRETLRDHLKAHM